MINKKEMNMNMNISSVPTFFRGGRAVESQFQKDLLTGLA
jgi:hypothetical protein